MYKKAQVAKIPALIASIGIIGVLLFSFFLLSSVFSAPQVNSIQSNDKLITELRDVVFLKMPTGNKIVADLIAENDFQNFRTYLKKYLDTDKCFITINKLAIDTGCRFVKKPNRVINTKLPLYNGSVIDVHLEIE